MSKFDLAAKIAAKLAEAAQPVKEQKMLQGMYRGYAGDYNTAKAAQDSGLVYATPQRAAAEAYAANRSKQAKRRGADDTPHVDMLLVDPFVGRRYGHSTLGTGAQGPIRTLAGEYTSDQVGDITNLYAEGGSVQRSMEHTRSSGQDATTQPLTGSALKALVRGWMAGTAGLPGDLEGLARTVDKYTTLNPAIRQLKDTTPVLPTADFYKEWLPGKQQGDEVIGNIGSLFGGVGATKPVALGKGALSRIAAATPAPRAGSMAAQRGVIKAPGGNWLSGSVEDSLKGLKPRIRTEGVNGHTAENVAADTQLNNWIDKQLRNYVRNDMATERDPIRALAESWATQKPQKLAEAQARIEALNAKGQELAATRGVPQEYLTRHRQDVIAAEKAKELIELRQGLHVDPAELNFRPEMHGKFLAEGQTAVAQSLPAKVWEGVTDEIVAPMTAQEVINNYQGMGALRKSRTGERILQDNPWLTKVPPDTLVHTPSQPSVLPSNLGFDHLIDELRNAVNPESGLPKELLFNPAHMGKITVPQAVERVADINAWRAAQKAEADMARANNAATVLHKDYPEKGMKWVELKKTDNLPEGWSDEFVETPLGKLRKFRDPKTGGLTATDPTEEALRDALKYEGDQMAHCVGGYCPDVMEGRSRIFSLRDAKGKPHTTIEVNPSDWYDQMKNRSLDDSKLFNARFKAKLAETGLDPKGRGPEATNLGNSVYAELFGNAPEPMIKQVKGFKNGKPDDEYLPYVQDFVKSGKWSDVGDLQNTGLRRTSDAFNETEQAFLRSKGVELKPYIEPEETARYQEMFKRTPDAEPGFAAGGMVATSPNQGYNQARVDELADSLLAELF